MLTYFCCWRMVLSWSEKNIYIITCNNFKNIRVILTYYEKVCKNEDFCGIVMPSDPSTVEDPSTFLINDLISAYIINSILSDFIYWLNSNILFPSDGITISQNLYFYFFMRFKFIFCSKAMKTIQTIKITLTFLMLFHIIMQIIFLLQDDVIPLFICLELLTEFFLTLWVMFWNISWKYFFFFNVQNIKSNCQIFFPQMFSNHLFLKDNLFVFSYVYL